MSTNHKVRERREQVCRILAKGMYRVPEIARSLNLSEDTVRNDLKYIKRSSEDWLSELGLHGFVHECRIAADKLHDMELELQMMRKEITPRPVPDEVKNAPDYRPDTGNYDKRMRIMNSIKDNVATQISLLGNHPTLIALRRATSGQIG